MEIEEIQTLVTKYSTEEREKRQQKVRQNVEDWLEFSINPRTEDEIRERVIADKIAGINCNTVCLSYVCSFSKLSENFIEELSELTKVRVNKKGEITRDRLDWIAISMKQTLSEDFIERHKDQVDWKLIFQFQKLSKEFKKKYKHKMEYADRELFNFQENDCL